MKIHLLRHTKPDVEEGICYGQADLDVNEDFAKEVEIIKRVCEKISYDVLFTSPLRRCHKLALALEADPDNIRVDDRLMEMNFGSWELKRWNDIENLPDAQSWFMDYVKRPAPGGESYEMVLTRVGDFIQDLRNANYKEVLIVGHKGIMIAINSILYGIDDMEHLFGMEMAFGTIMTLEPEKDT
jgi:alpha-ribazole phosphatase